jgi:hypothetical protein
MKTLLLPGCLSLLLMGCMTFDTNVNRSAVPTFSRVLVVSRLPVNSAETLAEFAAVFPARYAVCVVSADKLAFANPDSLIRQKARDCNSEVLLTIDLDRDYTTRRIDGTIDPVRELYLQMSSLTDNKPFWKAVARSEGALYPRQVVQQLRTDGIITGTVRPTPQPAPATY